jgi:hypothetical protein
MNETERLDSTYQGRQEGSQGTTPRVVVVDIDGVLHDAEMIKSIDVCTLALRGGQALRDAGLFALACHLERLLLEAGAHDVIIVVHSSWRKVAWATPGLIREALGPLGHRFEQMTSRDKSREESIEELCVRAGISDYVIIDDDHTKFRTGNPHLIVTNPVKGLSDETVLAQVRAWLCRLTPSSNDCHFQPA